MTDELLTAREVGLLLKCSRAQVYKLRRECRLPLPLQVFPGDRGTRWLRSDIDGYIQARIYETRTMIGRPSIRPFNPLDISRA